MICCPSLNQILFQILLEQLYFNTFNVFTYNIVSYFFLECVLQYTVPSILLLIISAMLSPVEM